MQGFFSTSKLTSGRKPLPLLPHCGDCGLYKTCRSPYMPVHGEGRKEIMVVGEAPGREEDQRGIPFVGDTGQFLKSRIRRAGLDPDKDCLFTNSLICRPPDNKIQNEASIEHCRPNLLKAIKEHDPKVIILLGKHAIRSVIGYLWKEEVGEVGRWTGWQIPAQRFNAWVCPTWHPSYLIREKDRVKDMFFYRHLKKALSFKNRPWKNVPDFRKQVEILDADDAAKAIKWFIKKGKPTAFDYETNMLKPDHPDFEIVCCSLSNGKRTIAFPWMEPAVAAMKKFVVSDVPKDASNFKYEHRVTKAVLKKTVRNWNICTMTLSHILDNRPNINSIKFQSFVRLGQEDYSDHITPFLQSKNKGGYAKNRIKQCDLNDLMLYCGLDSLLERMTARVQWRELNGSLRRS